jgi:hypothetical protein
MSILEGPLAGLLSFERKTLREKAEKSGSLVLAFRQRVPFLFIGVFGTYFFILYSKMRTEQVSHERDWQTALAEQKNPRSRGQRRSGLR